YTTPFRSRQVERTMIGDGAPERRPDELEAWLVDAAEELQRDVEVVGGDPARPADDSAQPLDARGQRRSHGGVEQDRDERSNAVYRDISSERRSLSMFVRRSGLVSIPSAARRSEIAPA